MNHRQPGQEDSPSRSEPFPFLFGTETLHLMLAGDTVLSRRGSSTLPYAPGKDVPPRRAGQVNAAQVAALEIN